MQITAAGKPLFPGPRQPRSCRIRTHDNMRAKTQGLRAMREQGRTESRQSGHQDTRTPGSPGWAGRKMPPGRAERQSPPEPSRNREEKTGPREGTKPAPRHGPPGDPSARERQRRRAGPGRACRRRCPAARGWPPTSPQRHPAARGTQRVEGRRTGREKPPPGAQTAGQQPPDAPANAPGGVLRPLRAGPRFQALEGAKGPSRANQGHLKAYSRQGGPGCNAGIPG